MQPQQTTAMTRPVTRYIPLSFFSMAVGTLAWSQAWQAAAVIWPIPAWWPLGTSLAGLALWALLWVAYLRKWREQPLAAKEELHHPTQSAMAALVPVSTLLAALSLKPLWPQLAQVLWVLSLGGQLALGLWLGGPPVARRAGCKPLHGGHVPARRGAKLCGRHGLCRLRHAGLGRTVLWCRCAVLAGTGVGNLAARRA
ncbi:hypothetical protein [Ideonella sp.]|uniref:SLAC1 family transporter n=1 Tax=Ideonella sp. TaxID=1929293 RepID=UPI0037C069F6